jgi:DNA segregation ATPase FtsK/SpoIIIE-like protein
MLKISRLETRFQEIVFLLTITFSLSVAVGGLFYLSLNPENFLSATGQLGSGMIAKGFSSFGYTYFFIVVFLLHMGHLTLATALNTKDFLRSSSIYIRSFAIYFTLLLLISSFLTVLQAYNQWPQHSHFPFGNGGWFGYFLGGSLYKSFGLYGALVILFSVTSVIGISAGYMEIVHSFYVMKDIFQEITDKFREHGPVVARQWSQNISNFINQKPEFAIPLSPRPERPKPILRNHHWQQPPAFQGGRLVTDHFHTPEELREEILKEEVKKAQAAKQAQEFEAFKKQQEDQRVAPQEKVQEAQGKTAKKTKKIETKEVVVQDEVLDTPMEVVEPQEEPVEIKAWTKRYKKVETTLLEKPEKKIVKSDKEIKELCATISERLESFGIRGEVIAAHQGVTLTMFEFMPAAGMKLSKIQSLADDLALVLGAKSIRILTPIPGKTTVGIEVPNKEMATLRFSEMIATCMKMKSMALPVPLGIDVYNKAHVNDLTKMPHLLVSGTTGSGKSVFMNSLISGLIFHKSPKELRFLMIDPKMIELSPYNGIPHLLKPVITDVEEAKNLLLWAEKEMDKRYQIFSEMQSKNIVSFNQSVKKSSKRAVEGRLNKKIDWKFEEMPYIVIVIDELADLMLTQRQEVERPITRIAQKARAAGIHMVMATQRPSSDIVTGLIKTNFPTRVSFKVSSNIDSRTILDQPGAEKLLGNGDMLFMAQGKAIERLQGSFMTEEEVKKVVRAVSDQGSSLSKKSR